MVIIHTGDCNVKRTAQYATGRMVEEDMGRVGPGAVLGSYLVTEMDTKEVVRGRYGGCGRNCIWGVGRVV